MVHEWRIRKHLSFELSMHPSLDECEILLKSLHADFRRCRKLNNHWMLLLQYRLVCNTSQMSKSSIDQLQFQRKDCISSKCFQINLFSYVLVPVKAPHNWISKTFLRIRVKLVKTLKCHSDNVRERPSQGCISTNKPVCRLFLNCSSISILMNCASWKF